MRRVLICLASIGLALLSTAGTWVMGPGKGSYASALANFSDDFSGSLTNWTTDAGSWAIDGGYLAQQSADPGVDKIHYNTACSTNNQYAKFLIISNNGGWVGPRFRVTGTTGYMIYCRTSNDEVTWKDTNGVNVQTSTAMAIADNDVLGFTIEGSGNSTVLRVWLNPTGLPTSTSNWNGDSTPDLSFTDNPTTATDSGSFVGMVGYFPGQGEYADNFFGGDCP